MRKKEFLYSLTSESGIIEIAKIAIKGLRTETAIHMFFKVFGKTPLSCSSTKFAELSNPKFRA
jgi:hypothetical protein